MRGRDVDATGACAGATVCPRSCEHSTNTVDASSVGAAPVSLVLAGETHRQRPATRPRRGPWQAHRAVSDGALTSSGPSCAGRNLDVLGPRSLCCALGVVDRRCALLSASCAGLGDGRRVCADNRISVIELPAAMATLPHDQTQVRTTRQVARLMCGIGVTMGAAYLEQVRRARGRRC